jgi:light-regulated signal transduction histidine kinase (bacteriophytochrome)
MDRTQKTDEQLAALASHLATRRVAVLQAWRKSVDNDPELTAPSSLPRTQFYDHIPTLLDALQRRLHVWPRQESTASEEQRKGDAAGHGLCEHLQPLAAERGLFLKADGPATLSVEGDAVKIRRIAQNLLLNALKYTQEGGVTMRWGDSRNNNPEHWMLCVQDTGPGFHAGPRAPLAGALKEATKDAGQADENAGKGKEWPSSAEPVPSLASPPDRRRVHQERGEGIGLSIVKRLCELLDASVELESKPGESTTFRVVLPRRYATEPKE